MAMRLVALAIAVAVAHPASAERRLNSLAMDGVVPHHPLGNQDRIEVAPYAGTSLGGELYRQDSWGGALRYHLDDSFIAIVDVRWLGATPRLTLPIAATSDRRVGAGSTELGYVPFVGKLDDARFDLVTSIGPGVVVLDHDTQSFAVSGGATLRVYIGGAWTAELAVHDDYVPWDPAPRAAALTIATREIDPARHDIEVRAGVGVWWPSRPDHRCCCGGPAIRH